MPYPDDRYPKIPVFPRPQNTLMTKNAALMDRDWYEVVSSYIESISAYLGGNEALPIGTEDQTVRYTANATLVATSTLKIHTDGPENTVDHADGTLPRMVNVVYVASPGALVDASSAPVGTLGIIYTP
jgi:hypothetical protein